MIPASNHRTDEQRAAIMRMTVPQWKLFESRLPTDAGMADAMKLFFGERWRYEPADDVWIAPDPKYAGPGRQFYVVSRGGNHRRVVISEHEFAWTTGTQLRPPPPYHSSIYAQELRKRFAKRDEGSPPQQPAPQPKTKAEEFRERFAKRS